jgi:hypothetical protein
MKMIVPSGRSSAIPPESMLVADRVLGSFIAS